MLILLFSVSFVIAAGNLTTNETARNCLVESDLVISQVLDYNLSTNRFNDTLVKAKDLYNAQVIIESKKGKPNYELVVTYCTQIKDLKQLAIESWDSYNVFLVFYNETIDQSMDKSTVESIISQINTEFAGERYESISRLIDQGYNEISKIKSEQTALVLAYQATTRGIGGFFKDNWIMLLSVFILLLAVYLLYRTRISLWILKRNLASLMLRRDTLKNLMSETQKNYFQYGTLPESTYRMRIKNFGELVRDIDRQIPLLQKDIAKYSFQKSDYDKVNQSERDRARLSKTD